MPLRRARSLNDKATRQKQRVNDVVRDPRSPGVAEGRTRTRTCLDNYQLLVHLKKQTDDKSRQLELALTYSGNPQPVLRAGGAQHGASQGRPWSELHPSPSTAAEWAKGGPGFQQPDRSGPPNPTAHYRQHSAGDGCPGRDQRNVVDRAQESFSSEGQPGRSSIQQQQHPGQKCPRPVSMFEPRDLGSPVQPPPESGWGRRDQNLHNLMQSQRLVNSHNRRLLGKVEELELENARMKAILKAHNIPHVLPPAALALRSHDAGGGPPLLTPEDFTPSPGSEAFPKLTSPVSETSVSGYGSLVGSACGEGCAATLEGGGGGRRPGPPPTTAAEAGGYNDDTLPLSEVSVERVGSDVSTLPSTLSSGGHSSRAPTMDRESVKGDLESLHQKVDQIMELERHKGSDRKKRVVELERHVAELTEQRKAVLDRYKYIVDENEKLQRREERVQEDLRSLLQEHGQSLERTLHCELQNLHQELQGLGHDVRGKLERLLTSLTSSSSSSSSASSLTSSPFASPERQSVVEQQGRSETAVVTSARTEDPDDVVQIMEQMVDLIGPEYLRLGRRLNVPPLELERIETGQGRFAHKTREVLRSWMRHRKGEEEEGQSSRTTTMSSSSPAQILTEALRDIDKDVRLFNDVPISRPERDALRKSLEDAIYHVTNPGDLFDHLIVLNKLTPAAITFIQEVLRDHPQRALCRLWHVLEYRGSGVVPCLALALERCGHPHVSRMLTEELEIQTSLFHSHQYHPLNDDEENAAPPVLAARNLGSRPSPSHTGWSRRKSGPTRPRPETVLEAVGLPVRPVTRSDKTLSLPLQDQDEVVWDRRGPGGVAVGYSPRRLAQGHGTRVSRV